MITGPFYSGEKFLCLSSDTKPVGVSVGAECYETDTGYNFIYDGVNWVEDLRILTAVQQALSE